VIQIGGLQGPYTESPAGQQQDDVGGFDGIVANELIRGPPQDLRARQEASPTQRREQDEQGTGDPDSAWGAYRV
tara:strand:+ start:4447 stop:4668 length:222 start_codon:yes stop_codon:yes gene_type:complete